MAVVVTNAGRTLVVDLLRGAVSTQPLYVAQGAGGVSALPADTALHAEQARQLGSGSCVTTTQVNDTFQVAALFTIASAQSVGEAGLLTAASGGILFLHGDFTPVALNVADTVAITCQVQFS